MPSVCHPMLLPFYLAVLFPVIAALTSSQRTFQSHNNRLYNDLFTGYHREMSPYNGHGISNDSYPLSPVSINLQYARLIRVLEPELQHQNLVGDWQDPRLGWNASDYGGIDHIYVNRYTVWMPEVYPCESSEANVISPEATMSIRLNATGHLRTWLLYSAYFSCEFDVRRFPFDKQSCYYCFVFVHYFPSDELGFKMIRGDTAYIYDTSEWALGVHDTAYFEYLDESTMNMGLLYFNITLTRRPQFYVGLVITPTFLIGSLVIIGLFFGKTADIVNNGIGLGLATMMSMMVIVGILADAIAKSQYIPILGWYLIAEIALITLAVFALLSEEKICQATAVVINVLCGESKKSATDGTRREAVRTWLLDKGGHSNLILFVLFFLAHTVNLIVLFCS